MQKGSPMTNSSLPTSKSSPDAPDPLPTPSPEQPKSSRKANRKPRLSDALSMLSNRRLGDTFRVAAHLSELDRWTNAARASGMPDEEIVSILNGQGQQ